MANLRIAFMGTPDFAVPALVALANAEVEISCVYTQPPRKAGRGHRQRPSPVHRTAERLGFEVRHPETLRNETIQAAFRSLEIDVAVVCAYGLILPPALLEAPQRGCFNIHASLLPRWRGAAPIQRAILANDRVTGITIMKMDPGLDTGPILLAEQVPIEARMTAGELHDRLADTGARLIVDAVKAATLLPRPQPSEGVTYASKLKPGENRIAWSHSADRIERMVRAFCPRPGAWCLLSGQRLAIHEALVVPASGAPGTVIDHPFTVACGENALALQRVQMAGRSAMTVDEFVRGHPVPVGTVLS